MVNLVFSATQSQLVTFTLNEKLDCCIECYIPIFKITHELTRRDIYFTATDVSTSPGRENQFYITLVDIADVDIEDGKIHLYDKGTYIYNVYQGECDGPIDDTNLGTLLETGYLLAK